MGMQCKTPLVAAIALAIFLCNVSITSETEEIKVVTERDVPVPMRDGTILRADVHRPDRGGPYPILVHRTPYGKGRKFAMFVRAGYIVVNQDARGRYKSDGKWVSLFRIQTQEAEDGYDTVEWAARLSGSNGKVGTLGTSYPALLQWCLAPLRPPSLVVMSASSNPARIWDLNPSTIRPGSRLVWWAIMACDMRRKENIPSVHTGREFSLLWYDQKESQKWLHWLPWSELPEDFFAYETSIVKSWLVNPHVDPWGFDEGCKNITVPNLDIVGWYDQYHGNMLLFRTMAKEAATDIARKGSKIIIGPWSHSGLGSGPSQVGRFNFGPDAAFGIMSAKLRWFDYWLKGKKNGVDKDPPVRIFVMGDNKWRDEQHWPLQRSKEKIFYITSGGSANTPSGDGRLIVENRTSPNVDNYVYDPNDPVPTLFGSVSWPQDQQPLANRQDILVYQTEPLKSRIEVTGYPMVELHASSSAPDTDWFVRLIDVAPDGLPRDVSYGMVRARYRDGFDRSKLIEPNEVVKYKIPMRPTSNAFLPGHRIRLDITSSDFPNYDRNHNTAANQNTDATLVTAKQTIFHGGDRSTRIILPWVPNPIEEKSVEKEKPKPTSEEQTYLLHQAAADGDIKQIKVLISKGFDINTQDAMKRTPLHSAVKGGKTHVVQLLVKSGADVNASGGNYNRSPLYMAVEEDNIAIAEYLIAHGADVNAECRPLEDAPYHSSKEMVELLIAKGADINAGPWTSLHSAAEEGRKDIAELLIKEGADINAKEDHGRTPFAIAVNNDRMEVVELLLAQGADINVGPYTALHVAVGGNRLDIVELLIAKGADVNAQNRRGQTPLHTAARAGRKDIVKFLIQKGADINAKDDAGIVPLGHVLSTVKRDVVELLFPKNRIFDSKDKNGLTALHNAAVKSQSAITEVLLSKGAKVNEKDDNYKFMALHYAARFGSKNVTEVLMANGADVKAKDKWDYQPIHWAAYHDRPEIIELLISKGADVNVKTSLDQTPLELAIPRRNTAAVKVLRKYGAKE